MDKKEFKLEYEIDPNGPNIIIDENKNSFVAIRAVKWFDKEDYSVEIRKWSTNANGDEIPKKGVVFHNPHEALGDLTYELIDEGYGDTYELLEHIKKREDLLDKDKKEIESKIKKETQVKDSNYYNPKELFE